MPEAFRSRRPKRPLSCHDRALRLLAVRPRSRREMESRLRSAGFDAEMVAEEVARAVELARSRASRLRGLAPEVAYRHLVSFLARRGYEGAVARRAAASTLRPDPGAEGLSEA